MKISKKSQYGLRAMVYLAKNFGKKKRLSLKEISEKENIPFDFLEKIMSQLEKVKLVSSKKGAGGGYFLARKPERIKVGEIVKELEDIVPVKCEACSLVKKCLVKNVWRKAGRSFSSILDSTTLKDIT